MFNNKSQIIDTFKAHKNDTGSSKIQIALLTDRIKNLTQHFQINRKDNHSKNGLLKLVSTRRKLLKYLKRKQKNQYQQLILKLKLRK